MQPLKCTHSELQVEVSSHAEEAGFLRPPPAKRQAAATPSGRVNKISAGNPDDETTLPFTFPGPLVLPDDALAVDPKEPPQSLRSFIQERQRNALTPDRKTIYLTAPPTISDQLAVMKGWAVSSSVQPPSIHEIQEYLAAFYHPLRVQLLATTVAFVPWETPVPSTPALVGLQIGETDVTGIRTRRCPDKAFPRQLNLNDILDAAIEALPRDAYALCMITNHDLYEDEDDDFCCGRAYGGSRVSVVSMARYRPQYDEGLDHAHMWPASHCKSYVTGACGEKGAKRKKPRVEPSSESIDVEETPIGAAVKAALAAPGATWNLRGLWVSRVVRTVAHELGHCFCLAHCSYYACVMQSTTSVAEDVRQPPYLCPVCLAKVTRALGDANPRTREKDLTIARYEALARACDNWPDVAMFAGFQAWIIKRLSQLRES
ncbi:hypothetical protein OQA88_9134 [Cercophora sp. LCS_1]